MRWLTFIPVLSCPEPQVSENTPSLPLEPTQCRFPTPAVFALRLSAGNRLAAEPVPANDSISALLKGDSSIAALVFPQTSCDAPEWILVACSRRLGLNGQTPVLPVAAIDLGDLLTLGEHGWMIGSLWRPEPVDPPDNLRHTPCPVCGGELGMTRVVQCACGRWSHLENPADANDPQALNCFLKAGLCGECGRRASLEAQLVPEVPASLRGAELDGDA